MRPSRRLALTLLPALWACGGSRPPDAESGRPVPSGGTTAAITAADLKARISIFADDSMLGRRAGTIGNVRGNAYIAAEAARLGLRPAGDDGGYLQRVPLVSYALDSAAATLHAGTSTLAPYADYYPYQPFYAVPVRPIAGAPIVYIGTMADSASLPSRDALQGKVVVFRSTATGNTLGAPDLSHQGRLGLIAGIGVTNIDPLLARYATYFRSPKLEIKGAVQAPPGATQPRMLFFPTAAISKVFGKPLDSLRPGDTGAPFQGEVHYEGTELPATNVVAILEGSDPALRGQYVALGAHNDAIGIVPAVSHDSLRAYNTVIRPRGDNDTPRTPSAEEAARIQAIRDSLGKLRPDRVDSIVNGADDDGSGSMGLLEIAEAMTREGPRPKRSLLFVWHTGEESGLQGSQWFTDHPTVPRDSIVAQINIDMIGRGDPTDLTGGGPGYLEVLGSRRLSTELGDLAEQVNREGKFGFQFNYAFDANGHPDQYYCRSDHANYARYGIPIVFFSTGAHRDYHQVTDEAQFLDYDKYANVVRYVDALTARVADLDHRVVVDKPKPDPKAPCKQ
ncbi:MAG TPA: M20/M25/M40 family metallo-hydrolase [Gemmatimonadales bacterium]|nr:M20/M25/M40 family metallo-hydrolase [Gemmatimonadales bacterium]